MVKIGRPSRGKDGPRFSKRLAGTGALPPGLLHQIEGYLHACLDRESPPRVSELAGQLGIGLTGFVETFHRATGMTPSAYLKMRQVEASELLLVRTKMPVDKVGYATGFGTRRTFFRQFRRHTGVSPARYRERARNASSLHRK